uniref:Uncharacterized protein n=1 Tax=Cacopsylla melanoneura TaxID=428564 RepID=A0A8D8WE49_9HEMI
MILGHPGKYSSMMTGHPGKYFILEGAQNPPTLKGCVLFESTAGELLKSLKHYISSLKCPESRPKSVERNLSRALHIANSLERTGHKISRSKIVIKNNNIILLGIKFCSDFRVH